MDELGRHCTLRRWNGHRALTAAGLREALADADGLLCVLSDRLDEAALAAAPRLRFVASVSVGVDHIDLAAATARGIPVGNTPGVLVEATADTAFALLLAAARRVAEGDAYVRSGRWGAGGAWSPDFFLGADVAGTTLGIIGLGAIGRALARRAQGFGMRVLGWNRTPRAVPGVEAVSLADLLTASDHVSIHLALTPDTRGLIDAARLALLPPHAVLVNTARGGIVDEGALSAALASGRLGAAGLDVFEHEPVSAASPLLRLRNVVLTPHVGSATPRTRRRMVDLAAANALAALAGEPMPHCVNRGVYGA